MWISKQEYDALKEKSAQYDGLMKAMSCSGSSKFAGYHVMTDAEFERVTRMAEHTVLEEKIKDLKAECDSWINLYRQKDADAEFWKSLYVDFRKLYEESCTVKK